MKEVAKLVIVGNGLSSEHELAYHALHSVTAILALMKPSRFNRANIPLRFPLILFQYEQGSRCWRSLIEASWQCRARAFASAAAQFSLCMHWGSQQQLQMTQWPCQIPFVGRGRG